MRERVREDVLERGGVGRFSGIRVCCVNETGEGGVQGGGVR